MSYRILKLDDLKDPGHMLPVIVLKSEIKDVARQLHAHPMLVAGDERSWQLLLDIDGVQVAMLASEGDPGFVHLYVAEEAISERGFGRFERLLQKLPLHNIQAGWWERHGKEGWPGNDHRSFVINKKHSPRY
ncbi:hypothetical protein [Burkholderia gladioli]|uniref:hypothetical protein n=1 Tax=Burkholderia gladioli TaxID=28095 RepID=UPI001640CBD8|nr:hypothetical protein [Burkholderia gladioli]